MRTPPASGHKVLSSIRDNKVQALLMRGQTCVLYGAAESNRDAELVALTVPENLARLQGALDDLDAHPPRRPRLRSDALPICSSK